MSQIPDGLGRAEAFSDLFVDGELMAVGALLSDAGSDPDEVGELLRNGADVKVYTGGGVKNLTNIGTSSGGLSDEEVEDIVGGLIAGGTNVTVTYDDGANTLTISVADISHGDLTNITASDHHAKTTSQSELTDFSSDAESITVAASAPSSPSTDDIWLDTS